MMTSFSPDDPRLTAYLLGELNEAERAEVEAALAADPQAQQALVDLMDLTGTLVQAFQREPLRQLPEELRAAVLACAEGSSASIAASPAYRPSVPGTHWVPQRFRVLGVAGTMSACLLMGVMLMNFQTGQSSAFNRITPGSLRSGVERQIALNHNDRWYDTNGNAIMGDDLVTGEPVARRSVLADLDELAEVQAVDGVNLYNREMYREDRELELAQSSPDPAVARDARLGVTHGSADGSVENFGLVVDGKLASVSEGLLQQQGQADDYDASLQNRNLWAASAVPQPASTSLASNAPINLTQPAPSYVPAQQPQRPVVSFAISEGTQLESDGYALPQVMLGAITQPQAEGGDPLAAGLDFDSATNGQGMNASLSSGRGATSGNGVTPLATLSPLDELSVPKYAPPRAFFFAEDEQLALRSATPTPVAAGREVKEAEVLARDEYYGKARIEGRFDHEQAERLVVEQKKESESRFMYDTESYAPIVENDFIAPQQAPFSTFGVDVDTAAYSNVRRFLDNNQWPPANAVRLEELVNAFQYSVPAPTDQHPVALVCEVAEAPWQPAHRLARVSLKAKEINKAERPATSLVFLIDKSGSMSDANKLPLLQDSLRLLVEELHENDRISIVTYADGANLVLEGATAADGTRIMHAIDSLNADGSTNGEAGLNLAYETAVRNQVAEGSNRILVCTDGDFNVGTSEDDALFRMIGEKRQTGVFLSILGFGSGNIKDAKLEGIADRGNGQYLYIDSLKQARRVLVEQLTGTLYTVAKDVKLQIEFNPHQVAFYRLLGYENRALAAEDFNNDRVDAGDMGAGHTVTALYELVPAGSLPQGVATVDASRYSAPQPDTAPAPAKEETAEKVVTNELFFAKLRYKLPTGDESVKLEFPVANAWNKDKADRAAASNDLQWAANVAAFGMLLRDSKYKGQVTWDDLLARTRSSVGDDPTGQRREFVDMVFRARSLWRQSHGESVTQPSPLASGDARQKATVDGKYSDLLDKLEIPEDFTAYGDFQDFGKWQGKAYRGHANLPEGYWVYVYPHWYIWGEVRDER